MRAPFATLCSSSISFLLVEIRCTSCRPATVLFSWAGHRCELFIHTIYLSAILLKSLSSLSLGSMQFDQISSSLASRSASARCTDAQILPSKSLLGNRFGNACLDQSCGHVNVRLSGLMQLDSQLLNHLQRMRWYYIADLFNDLACFCCGSQNKNRVCLLYWTCMCR